MDVKVRKGRVSDFANIARSYWKPEVPWDPIANPRMLKEHVGAKGFLVAETDGEFAGFLHYLVGQHPWFDKGTSKYGQILELFVKTKFQGQGIGQIMLERAITDLKRKGCSTIYTHTDETNEVALKLYAKTGFRPFLKTFYLKRRSES
ncbi:MAG: GNAT family N-acetyltransferase [Thaumarchaeota archaeon]|nr:GNAT family N-acetyltransferase [Nitrososphaerota archaeon]